MVRETSLGLELLHQPLERKIRIVVGVEADLAHPAEQLPEGGIAGEIRSQDERVDEEPDEVLGLTHAAAGDGGTHGDVLAPGIAVQQRLKEGEQRHEGGDPFLAGKRANAFGESGGKPACLARPAVGLLRRARAVSRQIQSPDEALEPLLPVSELPQEPSLVEPAPLPLCEVCVLDWQWRDRCGRCREKRGIQEGELAAEDFLRPAIEHDVVHGPHQDVVALPRPQQFHAQQRAGSEVEGALLLFLGRSGGSPPLSARPAESEDRRRASPESRPARSRPRGRPRWPGTSCAGLHDARGSRRAPS